MLCEPWEGRHKMDSCNGDHETVTHSLGDTTDVLTTSSPQNLVNKRIEIPIKGICFSERNKCWSSHFEIEFWNWMKMFASTCTWGAKYQILQRKPRWIVRRKQRRSWTISASSTCYLLTHWAFWLFLGWMIHFLLVFLYSPCLSPVLHNY